MGLRSRFRDTGARNSGCSIRASFIERPRGTLRSKSPRYADTVLFNIAPDMATKESVDTLLRLEMARRFSDVSSG